MKVCLIRPPTITFESSVTTMSTPPLGLAYVASALRSAGMDVYAIDAPGDDIRQYTLSTIAKDAMLHGLTNEKILERIQSDTDVVGVSVTYASEWLHARELLKSIKHKFPNVHLTIGGEQATALPEYCLSDCEALDSCVIGEGELTMVDLCLTLQNLLPLDGVPGLIFKKENTLVTNARRKRISAVDELAEPAWDLFNLEAYIDNEYTFGTNLGRSIPMLASRGCPYSCTFCSNPVMWTPVWKARSPALVIAEMKRYISRYRISNFDFYDLTAIVDREWILEFCRLLNEEKLKITWQLPTGTRSEVIDEEIARQLYKSGCRAIKYAPESGSPEELKRIKKKVNIAAMLKSMRGSVKAGLKIKANMIFGMPGATWTDVRITFAFLAKMAVIGVHDVGCFSFSPYPGSQMFQDLRKNAKIEIGEEYFRKILTFNDPVKSISFNDRFSGRQIQCLNYSAMLFFYFISFATRPWRPFRLFYSLLKNDRYGKLAVALGNRKRKKQIMRELRQA